MPILSVKNLTMTFGGLAALTNINISIKKGELVGLIGPNGAGKTTVFNLLTGIYTPTLGVIEYMQNGSVLVFSSFEKVNSTPICYCVHSRKLRELCFNIFQGAAFLLHPYIFTKIT
jgi:ABC-type branched-subunit amino acid transport system ATPase component